MNSLNIKSYLIIDDTSVSLTSFDKFEDEYLCIFHQELSFTSNLNDKILILIKNANNFLKLKIEVINVVLEQKKYQINNNCKILCSSVVEKNDIENKIKLNYLTINKHIISVDNCKVSNANNEVSIVFDCLTCDIDIMNDIYKAVNQFTIKIKSVRTELDLVDQDNNPILFIENNQVYMIAKLENNTLRSIDYTKEFESMLLKIDDNYNIGFEQTIKLVNIIDKCSNLIKNFEIGYFAKNKFKKGNYIFKNDFINKLNKNFDEFIAKITSKPIQIISNFSCWNNKNCLRIKTNNQLSMIISSQKKSILLEKLLNTEPSLTIKYDLIDEYTSSVNNKNVPINQGTY